MTLQQLKQKWQSELRNFTVDNLKEEDEFMADCMHYPEYRDYILRIRPEMRRKRPPKMKFRRPEGNKVPTDDKTPQIDAQPVEPEQVEELSKTGQIIKDLKAYKKREGYI